MFIAISVTVSFLVMGSAMKHTSKLTNSHKLLMKDEGRPCDITIGLRKSHFEPSLLAFWLHAGLFAAGSDHIWTTKWSTKLSDNCGKLG